MFKAVTARMKFSRSGETFPCEPLLGSVNQEIGLRFLLLVRFYMLLNWDPNIVFSMCEICGNRWSTRNISLTGCLKHNLNLGVAPRRGLFVLIIKVKHFRAIYFITNH